MEPTSKGKVPDRGFDEDAEDMIEPPTRGSRTKSTPRRGASSKSATTEPRQTRSSSRRSSKRANSPSTTTHSSDTTSTQSAIDCDNGTRSSRLKKRTKTAPKGGGDQSQQLLDRVDTMLDDLKEATEWFKYRMMQNSPSDMTEGDRNAVQKQSEALLRRLLHGKDDC